MLNNPTARLVGRAILTGVTTALVSWQSGGAAWTGAVVAGVLAGAELLTPLNQSVGVGKS